MVGLDQERRGPGPTVGWAWTTACYRREPTLVVGLGPLEPGGGMLTGPAQQNRTNYLLVRCEFPAVFRRAVNRERSVKYQLRRVLTAPGRQAAISRRRSRAAPASTMDTA